MACPLTSNPKCMCSIKDALRLLFTTHAVYTKFYIESSLNNIKDLPIITDKLLKNQKDIGEYIGNKLKSKDIGTKITDLLTSHILAAAGAIEALKTNSPNLQDAIKKVFENSKEVATYLSGLNPQKYPLDTTIEMFNMHNQYVLDIATATFKADYVLEYDIYDKYYTHMMEFSDTISNGLVNNKMRILIWIALFILAVVVIKKL